MYTFQQTLVLISGSCLVTFLVVVTFKKFKIRVNKKLVISLLPFLFILPLIRSLVDAGVLTYSILLVTPFIFLIPPLFLLLVLLTTGKLNEHLPYYINGISGIIILIYLLRKVNPVNTATPTVILVFTLIFCGLLHVIFTYFKFMSSLEDCGPIYSHIFDAITIIVGSTIGYKEVHIFPNFIISTTGTQISFLIVKFFIPFLSVYIINRFILDNTTNKIFKSAVFVSGCFPGLRNFFRILMMS